VISLVVADDQELVRDGLAAILGSEPDLEVIGTAADGAEAVGLVLSLQPDVVLMDIRMPEVDGIEATRRLVSAEVATRILVLTTFAADEYVLQALRVGASGFLLKDAPRASLLAGVRAVAAGDVTLEDSVLKSLVADHLDRLPDRASPPGLERLTAREKQVLHLVAGGQTNVEIARALFVSETTVKTHVARTLAKLGARDRIQLVVLAHRSGLV
jgi:DNA-binding NarL/FixJ family response regulator